MPSIEEIEIPKSIMDHFRGEDPFNSINGIKRLNCFVGPNNSGKSRLLRAIFLTREDNVIGTDLPYSHKTRKAVRALTTYRDFDSSPNPHLVALLDAAMSSGRFGFTSFTTNLGNDDERVVRTAVSNYHTYKQTIVDSLSKQSEIARNETDQMLSELVDALQTKARSRLTEAPFPTSEFVYIPTLRGMRLDQKDAYFVRTRKDYFKDKVPDASIQTGLDLFESLKQKLLGDRSSRDLVRRFEEFLSRQFFQGKNVEIIPRLENTNDVLFIRIGNVERPIHELGDGLQQVIIQTWPIFQHTSKQLFLFIEEPDMFLHPGYQRVLIETFIDRNIHKSLQVFVTTHSPQFMDITLSENDVALFKCTSVDCAAGEEQSQTFSVKNVNHGDKGMLYHVGALPSSLMLANCTIWVEGITDRLYYGRYLSLWLASNNYYLIENLHYAFVEYSGNNISHWSFLDEDAGINVERVCADLILVADNDDGKKDARHQKLMDVLGEERYIRLENSREVENLLEPHIITKVVQSYEGSEYRVRDFKREDYVAEYLGSYIENNVLQDSATSKRKRKPSTCSYSEKDSSGTLKDKPAFCERSLLYLNSFDDLSDEAKEIARRLGKFVIERNSC